MLGIMNEQWSALEYIILVKKLNHIGNLTELIKNTTKIKKIIEVVPLKVRIYYIKEYLNVIYY